MLAKKNDNIKSAYEILQKVSENKTARMAYEARQAPKMCLDINVNLILLFF